MECGSACSPTSAGPKPSALSRESVDPEANTCARFLATSVTGCVNELEHSNMEQLGHFLGLYCQRSFEQSVIFGCTVKTYKCETGHFPL